MKKLLSLDENDEIIEVNVGEVGAALEEGEGGMGVGGGREGSGLRNDGWDRNGGGMMGMGEQ